MTERGRIVRGRNAIVPSSSRAHFDFPSVLRPATQANEETKMVARLTSTILRKNRELTEQSTSSPSWCRRHRTHHYNKTPSYKVIVFIVFLVLLSFCSVLCYVNCVFYRHQIRVLSSKPRRSSETLVFVKHFY